MGGLANRLSQHWKYLRIALYHKRLVFEECAKVGLWWEGLVHDLSKFHPREFFPYSDWICGEKNERTKAAFEVAVNHHYNANTHHWEYWVCHGEPLEMPRRVVIEMIADWTAAGISYGSDTSTRGWYLQNKDRITLHPNTRAMLERLLRV